MGFSPMCETLLSFSRGKKAGIWAFQGLKSEWEEEEKKQFQRQGRGHGSRDSSRDSPRGSCLSAPFNHHFYWLPPPFLYSPEHFALLSLFSLCPPGCPLLLPQIETPLIHFLLTSMGYFVFSLFLTPVFLFCFFF